MRTKNLTRFLPLLLLMIFFIGGGKMSAQGFYESFDTNKGKGGNANGWNGSIANSKISSDNADWTFSNGYGAYKCAKFGTGSKKGSATTPVLEMSGDLVLTFKAGAWVGEDESATLNISLEGTGTFPESTGTPNKISVEIPKGDWGEYTVNISGAEAGFQIKFEAAQKSKNRFFLDEVRISENGTPSIPSPNLSFTEETKTVNLSDGAFTYAVTNPNNVPVTYSSSNDGVATVDNNGQVTPKAAGTATISAAFAGSDSYKAQTVSYELTVKDQSVATGTIDEITVETINNPNSNYSNIEGITVENGSGAVYAANAANEENNCIRIRSDKKNSGLVSTTSGGKVKSVTITWNSKTAKNRVINIYGNDKAYTSPANLYDETTNGDELGSLVYSGTETTSTYDIEGNYAFVGIRSKSGVIYIDKITIEWDNGSTPSLPSPGLAFAETTKTVDKADGTFTNNLTNSNEVTVTYSSSNESVATVDANGKVTPLAAGTTTISAAFAGNNKFSAQTVKYELTVTDKANAYTIATIKDALTETKGTYSLKFDNAVVSYVNGNNAYIEDANGAILFYADHAYEAGDVFNGTATVTGYLYNGTAELTSIDLTPTTGGTIPLTTVTAEELSKNIAQYDFRRVKVVDATLATAFTGRNASIEQNGTTIGLFNKNTKIETELKKITAGSTVDVIGFAGTYKNNVQINVWETADITVKEYAPVTFSTNAQDPTDGYCYGTLYSNAAVKLPENVIGSTVKYANGKLQMDWEYDSDKTVPAGTAIVVMAESKGDHTATVVADDTQKAPADNKLKGSATDTEVSDDNSYFYILTFSYENNAKTLGFYWQNETGNSVQTKGGKAYLQLPVEASLSAVKGFSIGKSSVTGIGSIKQDNAKAATIYTISGVKVNASVNSLPKGIYIVNGQKVMVK